MLNYRLLFFILIVLGLSSCNNSNKELTIAAANPSTSNYTAALILQKELENNTDIGIKIADGLFTSHDNIKSVVAGESDLAVIQNTIDYNSLGYSETELNNNVRTILPLYDQVLFIIFNKNIKADNLYNLVDGRKVGFGKENGGDAWLVQEIFSYLGIPDSIYTPVYTDYSDNRVGDMIDISCSVTSYSNPRIAKMLRFGENKLFSFEKSTNIDKIGSAVSGIGLKNTTLSKFIIPKNSYGFFPQEPVLTVCTKAILICNKSLDENISYEITRDILENKTLIASANPIFDIIRENFNMHNLRFPLHYGVKMYLDRNKPTFLEKYAEVLALIITISVMLFGGISSLRNWNKIKKKDRIDVYYQQVINIDDKINKSNNKNELKEIEIELFAIRDSAFDQLIKEKLIADESFNIFLRLIEQSINRVNIIRKS